MNNTEEIAERNIIESTLSVDAPESHLVDGNFVRALAVSALLLLTACAARPSGAEQAKNGYVDPKACASCHPGVARAFARTGMGRSFAPASAELVPVTEKPFRHAASESEFSIVARDGRHYQRRTHASGTVEKRIDYVMGSGALVRTFLHRSPEGKLIELPLSWYKQDGFAMSPGFDRPDHAGFRRAISVECMFCHNAYPANFEERRGEEPVFPAELPAGVDCQRCHGPGAAHVSQGGRGAIVNPARLSPKRQFEVCLQCHLETTSFPLPDALMNFGNAPFSFQPGKALGDYRTYFDHAPGKGRDDKFEIVSAGYRLRQAKCFLATGPEKLQCTTCHDPHGAEETNVTRICQSCHAGLKPGHPAVAADAKCEGCHMPKRRTEDVVHAVVTDHRIAKPPAQPAKLLAARAERHETGATAYRGEVMPYYPPAGDPEASLDMAAVAQVVQQANLTAGIPRLEALRQRSAEHELVLADALRAAGRASEALPHYAKAAEDASFIAARFAYGMALRLAGDATKAKQVLEAALQAAPNRPKGWYELGMAHLAARDTAAALKAFDKALALDPDFVEALNARAGLAVTRGDRGTAETGVGEALKLEPRSAEARNNLGSLLLAEGRVVEALPHFEAAVRALPSHVPARYNYALALARARRFADARREVEAVLALDGRHAGAHQVLGALLAGQGQAREAITHYRAALGIEPDFGRALVGLAPLVNDPVEAKRLLEQALRHADPSVRQQAAALLAQR